MLVKYKNLETGNIISDSQTFAQQFRLQHCIELELETVERLIYIISSYIAEEESQANLSIMTYNNYYSNLVGQKYEEKDIKRGVKFSIIAGLNDIYECTSFEDAQNTILDRSFNLMEQNSDSGAKVWVERSLTTNRYLSPLLHLLGIKEFDDITDFISSERFPENYPLEKINSLFKEMFSNIREATIRNLDPTKIEDFTDEQKKSDRKLIAKTLNEANTRNPSENVQHNITKVSFAEESQVITYSDDEENIDNSGKRKSPEKNKFVERFLEGKRDEKHARCR